MDHREIARARRRINGESPSGRIYAMDGKLISDANIVSSRPNDWRRQQAGMKRPQQWIGDTLFGSKGV